MNFVKTQEDHFVSHGYNFPLPKPTFSCLTWNRETIAGEKQMYKVVVDDVDYGDLEVFARVNGEHAFVVCEAQRSGIVRELLEGSLLDFKDWTGNLKFKNFLEVFHDNQASIVSEIFYDMSVVVVLKEQVDFSDIVVLRARRCDIPALILDLMCNKLVHSVSWTGYARNFVYAACEDKTVRVNDYERFYLLESVEDQFSRINSMIDLTPIDKFVKENVVGWKYE